MWVPRIGSRLGSVPAVDLVRPVDLLVCPSEAATSWPPSRDAFSVPDANGHPVHAFRLAGKCFSNAERDPLCAPRGGGGVEDVIKRSARRLAQRPSIVHRPKGHLWVNLANALICPREIRHVEDAKSECMRLGRYAESQPVRSLKDFA